MRKDNHSVWIVIKKRVDLQNFMMDHFVKKIETSALFFRLRSMMIIRYLSLLRRLFLPAVAFLLFWVYRCPRAEVIWPEKYTLSGLDGWKSK